MRRWSDIEQVPEWTPKSTPNPKSKIANPKSSPPSSRPHHRDHPPPRVVLQPPSRIVQDPRHAHLQIQGGQAADGQGAEAEAVLQAGEAQPVALRVPLGVPVPEAVALVEDGGRQDAKGALGRLTRVLLAQEGAPGQGGDGGPVQEA